MAITKTIHPPSGGTALIAATQADIRALGWYYVPVVMLSAVLMMTIGLITNNIQRQYPMYWWTSGSLGPQQDIVKKVVVGAELSEGYESELTVRDVEKAGEAIILSSEGVIIPDFLGLSYDQRAVLDELQTKIKEYHGIREETIREEIEERNRQEKSIYS